MRQRAYPKILLISFLFLIFSGCSQWLHHPAPGTKTNAPDRISDTSSTEAIFNPTRQWPQELSDLQPDPNVIYKTLPNGFRYVLMKNNRPENRVSMHLFVQAGSMDERENERGLAHFLEHMLFNGTKHFKSGDLVKYFQKIGMQFGPDANAHTGFYSTVYDIDLPEGDPKSLGEGLLVMSDYASGALLSEDEIVKERPVILAEKRTRDSVGYRTFESTFKFELPDALLSERLPIGTEEAINNADHGVLNHFYDAWYRPDRVILVMVGDFDIHAAEPLIANSFKDLTPRAPAESYNDPGTIHHTGTQSFYHFEPEAGNTSITIETLTQEIAPPDTAQQEKKKLLVSMANHIINKRLSKLLDDPKTPFTQAMISSGDYLNYVKGADISADTSPEKWQETLSLIEQTLRKALTYGFTDSEVELAEKAYTARLDAAVKAEPTRESRSLARQIMHSFSANQVFQNPEQVQKLQTPMIDAVTAKDLLTALKNDWNTGGRQILVTGNIDLNNQKQSPVKQILNTYDASMTVAVKAPEEKKTIEFPYLPSPAHKGKIVHREDISDLGIISVEFENGVRLNIKPTDFKANEVKTALIFGNGEKGEPASHPGLSALSQKVIQLSGTGTLNRDELKQALTGKNTSVNFEVDDDHFTLNGVSVTDEIPLLFQLYQAYIDDPGFREDAYTLAMAQFTQEYDALKHSISGGMALEGARFLAGGDTRFGLPDFDTFRKNTLADVRDWISPPLKAAPIEISIVGDLDPQKVIDLAATYLGSLPARNGKTAVDNDRHPEFPVGKSLTVSVPTIIPKGMVDLVFPTDDFRNIRQNRRLSVLSQIISDRMRIRIREEMGASYSSYAYNDPSRAYDGYGLLNTVVQIAPKDTEEILAALHRIVDDLTVHGIDQDELNRALTPILASIRERVKTNGYWLGSVMTESSRYPAQLDWSRTFLKDYSAITESEIDALAKKFLDLKKAATVVIMPDGSAEKDPAAPSASDTAKQPLQAGDGK